MPRYRRHFSGISRLSPRLAVAGTLFLGLTLSACTVGEPYGAPRFAFLPGYKATKTGAPVLLSNTEWWRGFQDPALDHLVALALVDNLTIAAARERVVTARAASRQIANPLTLNTAAQSRITDTDTANYTETSGEIGLSWMLDPFGQRRSLQNAAWARIDAADAEADSARLLVLYNLCNAYVDLRYAQRLLELRRQEIVSRRQTLSLAERMSAANAGTRLELVRARARLSDVEAQIPMLEAQIRGRINQIAVLTGRVPGTLQIDLTRGKGQPVSALSPDVGIPADLLRNRPDIRVAERLYYAAVAETGVAKAALYPRLSLSGAISLTSRGGQSINESYFGPTLTLPTFPGQAARAGVDRAQSAARLAHTTWKATVMDAILEVENALLEYQASRKARAAAERSLTLYREAKGLVEDVLENGAATIDDLIDAEQSVTIAANTLADTRRQQGLDFIALNVRLGSGSRAGADVAEAVPEGQ